MNSNKKISETDIRTRFSILWIVVMLNMIFADILTLFIPEFLQNFVSGTTPFPITQQVMLVMAIIIEIPIIMILLSQILKPKTNYWTNIIASIITIIFVVGGGSLISHYIFFATIEVICLTMIIRYASKLLKQ